MGRPSEYSEEKAESIIDYLSETGSVSDACEVAGIARSTLRRWCEANADFATAIARAKMDGYDNMAEKARQDAKNASDPLKGRLAFDADRWYLSKIDPKRYGDRIAQEISGPDGGPIQQEVTRSAEEMAQFAAMMAQANKELPG